MKFARLLKYSFSRHFLKELFLVIQLTLMLLFAFSILSPVDEFVEMHRNLDELYFFDFDQTLFFNPNASVYQSVNGSADQTVDEHIYAFLEEVSADTRTENLMRMSYNSTQIKTGKTTKDPHTGSVVDEIVSANLILYENEYLQNTKIEMIEGTWADGNSDEYVSIAVSQSLADIMPIGTKCSFDLSGSGEATSCMVTGILSEDCILPSTYGFASFPNLVNIGTRIADVKGAHFIIAEVDEESFSDTRWEYSCFITVSSGVNVEELCKGLNSKAGTIGQFYSVGEITKQSFTSLLRSNSTLIFDCILLGLIAIFGYGGYLYLSICRRQKDFSILYILGLTRKRSVVLNTFSGVLILFVSFVLAYVIYPSFQKLIGISGQNSLGIISIIFTVLFFSFVLFLSYVAAFRQFYKATTISLYQGGD